MTLTWAFSLPLAAEWSNRQIIAVCVYLALAVATGVLAIMFICRNNPDGPRQMGKAGAQLIMLASLAWPIWFWFGLPWLWSKSEARGTRKPRPDQATAGATPMPEMSAGLGGQCERCGDRLNRASKHRPWGKHFLCGRCAADLGVTPASGDGRA